MICPNCSGNHISVTPVAEKDKRGCFGTLLLIILALIPVLGWIALFCILRGRKTKTRMYATCQDCGYSWQMRAGDASRNVVNRNTADRGMDERSTRQEVCCVCGAPMSYGQEARPLSVNLPDHEACPACVRRLKELRRLSGSGDPAYKDAVRRFVESLNEEAMDDEVVMYLQGVLRKCKRAYRDAREAQTGEKETEPNQAPSQTRASDQQEDTGLAGFLHRNSKLLLAVLAMTVGTACLILVLVAVAPRSKATRKSEGGVLLAAASGDTASEDDRTGEPQRLYDEEGPAPVPEADPYSERSPAEQIKIDLSAYDTSATYADALAFLKQQIELLWVTYGTQDEELDYLLMEYQARYKNEVLESAKAAFAAEGHAAAITLIQSSFKLLDPEDAELVAALDYYSQYAPVYICDLDFFTSEEAGVSGDVIGRPSSYTDNTGKEHAHVLRFF